MYKEQFRNYLKNIYTKADGSPLSDSSVNHYSNDGITRVDSFIRDLQILDNFESIYELSSISELEQIKKRLFQNEEFRRLDESGNRMYSAGLNRYLDFAEGTQFANKADMMPLLDTPIPVSHPKQVPERPVMDRDRIIIRQVSQAMNYSCEINPNHKTFIAASTKKPYMEGHHIIPLFMQKEFSNSLDVYSNVIILCPTCHRLFHYGDLDKSDRKKYLNTIYESREERFYNSGIGITRAEFIEITTESSRPKLYQG